MSDQLYLSMIELFALVFSLILGILQASLNASTCPLFGGQLGCKLLVFLFGNAQGLISLGAEIGCNPDFVPCFLNLFLSHRDLLDSLHIGKKRVR